MPSVVHLLNRGRGSLGEGGDGGFERTQGRAKGLCNCCLRSTTVHQAAKHPAGYRMERKSAAASLPEAIYALPGQARTNAAKAVLTHPFLWRSWNTQ